MPTLVRVLGGMSFDSTVRYTAARNAKQASVKMPTANPNGVTQERMNDVTKGPSRTPSHTVPEAIAPTQTPSKMGVTRLAVANTRPPPPP